MDMASPEGRQFKIEQGEITMISDTITAISTAVGEAGIAVIRVSGPEAVSETEKIFAAKPL